MTVKENSQNLGNLPSPTNGSKNITAQKNKNQLNQVLKLKIHLFLNQKMQLIATIS